MAISAEFSTCSGVPARSIGMHTVLHRKGATGELRLRVNLDRLSRMSIEDRGADACRAGEVLVVYHSTARPRHIE